MMLPLESGAPVRVLVVDDSAFMRAALTQMITSEADFEVAGTARCASDALEKIALLDPDVVTLDVNMPGLDGLGTLRLIMQQFPRPVIMVSTVTEKDAATTFAALSAGAFDYVPKQLSATSLEISHIRADLIAKIRAAAQSRARRAAPQRKPPQSAASAHFAPVTVAPAVVAIGVSTGGPKALEEIMPRFPNDFPVPMLIVQHMPNGFTAPFAQRLNSISSMTVREAVAREPLQPGIAYIAPAGRHMRVAPRLTDSQPIISLDFEPEHLLHRPSVDVLLTSVAEFYGHLAMGVIMTGMGNDGVEGMTAIHRQGGLTIGQDEATSVVYGMPRACAELGILSRVVPLLDIPAQILHATRNRSGSAKSSAIGAGHSL